ncbi:hypothetical protein NMG60_11022991 [Bertholletia excelsa]
MAKVDENPQTPPATKPSRNPDDDSGVVSPDIVTRMAKVDENPQTPVALKPSPKPKDDASIVPQDSLSRMTKVEENPGTAVALKPSPNPEDDALGLSQANSPQPRDNDAASLLKKSLISRDYIRAVAAKTSSMPLRSPNPDLWGVLTAISDNARKRPQGMHILLTSDEHCIGRSVDEKSFQIDHISISGNHCRIYRKRIASEDAANLSTSCTSVCLKDTSMNGTFLNWERLRKTSPEAELCHGDIVSFLGPPESELAYAFVFREVMRSNSLNDDACLKRKAEEIVSESKRLKGIGIGAPEGPISLDDFRSLQRSNVELRSQLEIQDLTIDSLQNGIRETAERHEIEMKDLKESISKSYINQLKELQNSLEVKQKELVEMQRVSAEQNHKMEDLNERLSASTQSCVEANEIINSQKASISELKAQLDEEREQRREEREQAAIDLKVSIQKVQAEAQEELKRFSDSVLRREKEQQEAINKLQRLEKERCLLVENLRSKLEDTRQKLVISDNKVRQLEAQVCEEQLASACGKKRVEELEHETQKLRRELENEKQAAREEAWAKVSALELEINAAMRDLDFERRRLKGARERIMLRETQLRAFYSTTEEISVLFTKQQEQLKAMQRTLEDEENYENASIDIDLTTNPHDGNANGKLARKKEASGYRSQSATNARLSRSAHMSGRSQPETSSDSVTEKHDCDVRSQDDGQNTQETECASTEQVVKSGFGSDINGVGSLPVQEGDVMGTERILETESPRIDVDKNVVLNKCGGTFVQDTMQLDDDANEQEALAGHKMLQNSRLNNPLEIENPIEDTEAGGTIRTADLLASEVIGSWACSTAPSVHGENESPRSRENDEEGFVDVHNLHNPNTQVAESQSAAPSLAVAEKWDDERRALGEMIGIVDPGVKEQFDAAVLDKESNQEKLKKGFVSNSDTEDCTDSDDENGDGEGSDQANENEGLDNTMGEDDEATQEDSVG